MFGKEEKKKREKAGGGKVFKGGDRRRRGSKAVTFHAFALSEEGNCHRQRAVALSRKRGRGWASSALSCN